MHPVEHRRESGTKQSGHDKIQMRGNRAGRGQLISALDAIKAVSLFHAIGDDDLTTAHMIVALYFCSSSFLLRDILRGLRHSDSILTRLDKDDIERCMLLRELLVERSVRMAAKLFEGWASTNCVGTNSQYDTRMARICAVIPLSGDMNVDKWLGPDALGELMQSRINGMELEGGERDMRDMCGDAL